MVQTTTPHLVWAQAALFPVLVVVLSQPRVAHRPLTPCPEPACAHWCSADTAGSPLQASRTLCVSLLFSTPPCGLRSGDAGSRAWFLGSAHETPGPVLASRPGNTPAGARSHSRGRTSLVFCCPSRRGAWCLKSCCLLALLRFSVVWFRA